MEFSGHFKDLTEAELQTLKSRSHEIHLDKGQILFNDGDEGETFFLILEGEVDVLKGDTLLATLKNGEILGEMAIIGEHTRSAMARAKSSVHLLEVSLNQLSETEDGRAIAEKIRSHFSIILKERVKGSNTTAVEAIKKQLEHEQARSHLGVTLIYVLLAIFCYIYAITAINLLQVQVISTTVISVPVLIMFAFFMFLAVKKTGYPLKDYGFTLLNWKKDLLVSFLWSIPVLALVVLFKWIMIQTVPTYSKLHLISISPALNQDIPFTTGMFVAAVVSYCIFVPVQEIIYRGAMQTILEKLLLSPHKTMIAILITNLPFSLIHLHLSFLMTLIVYFYGIFWGIMFAYQRSLVGVTFSHLIIGFWNFFIIGVQDVLPV